MFRPLFALLAAALAAALSACGALHVPGLSPYRMEIQQGNFVSQETLSQLKAGMSKEQVRLALGTPLLTDLFHADRWDYVYYRDATDRRRESRKVAVYFADGKLARVDGGGISLEPQSQPVPPPPATQAPAAPAAPGAVPPPTGGAAAAVAAEGAAAATPQGATPPLPQPPAAPATKTPPAEETR